MKSVDGLPPPQHARISHDAKPFVTFAGFYHVVEWKRPAQPLLKGDLHDPKRLSDEVYSSGKVVLGEILSEMKERRILRYRDLLGEGQEGIPYEPSDRQRAVHCQEIGFGGVAG